MIKVKDYPKTMCAFERTTVQKRYLATDTILPGMEWVFDPGVRAVDKLHGSNHCVILDAKGDLLAIDNRSHRVFDGTVTKDKLGCRALSGYLNAIDKGWLKDIELGPEFIRVYGELVAPDINGNLHKADKPYFVPFDMLASRCHWKSWLEGRYPKNFESLSEWFKQLPSLFSKKYFGVNVLAEGLIFRHPDGRRCKLRRSMFEWYEEGEGEWL